MTWWGKREQTEQLSVNFRSRDGVLDYTVTLYIRILSLTMEFQLNEITFDFPRRASTIGSYIVNLIKKGSLSHVHSPSVTGVSSLYRMLN